MTETNAPAAPESQRRRILIPVALVLAAALGYGIYWLVVVRGTVYTDDAQVQGLIVPSSSRVGGRVVEILVWEGQTVIKGQVLVKLDEMPYRAQLDEAKAAVQAAEAQLEAANLNLRKVRVATGKEVAMARADLRAAQAREALARREKGRFTHVQDFVTGESVDQVSTAWSGSDAALSVAQQRLSMLTPSPAAGDTTAPRELEIEAIENQVAMAEANLALVRARLELAENNFAEITVTALTDGWVSRRHVEPGQVVSSGSKLFSITSSAPPWIEANFEEGDIGAIRPGDRVKIKIDAFPGKSFTGRVEGVLPASISRFSLLPSGASSGNFIKVTQRVPVRIALEGDHLPFLFPGLNVEVRVTVGSHPTRPAATAARR